MRLRSRGPDRPTRYGANSPTHQPHSLPRRSSPAKPASEVWSGRRGSNPRPTAWKAVTLPLSYSRLRARLLRRSRTAARQAPPRRANQITSTRGGRKIGGEGRVRTSVATRAADLQSAAIDRSATSPNFSSQASALQRCGPGALRPGPAPFGAACASHVLDIRVWFPCPSTRLRDRAARAGHPEAKSRGADDASSRWSWRRDLNPRPADYKSAALPD